MNKTAERIGMVKTNYANSHGLVNSENRSCAFDIAVLCEHAMNNPEFRKIVSCRAYETEIAYSKDPIEQTNSFIQKPENSGVEDEVEEGVDRDLDSN